MRVIYRAKNGATWCSEVAKMCVRGNVLEFVDAHGNIVYTHNCKDEVIACNLFNNMCVSDVMNFTHFT